MEITRKAGAAAVQTVLYLLAALMFLLPLARLLIMGVTLEDGGYGLDNFIALLAEERTREAIANTIVIAVTSTALAAIFGSGLAFLTAYSNVKRKGLIEFLILLPFIIPSYIITLSWSSL